jgi:hypothetical protein
MNNYKSFSELKEELGNNYDFKLYEMGISALKELENLQQENKQLKEKINKLELLIESLKLGVTLNQEQEDLLDEILFRESRE